MGFVHDDLGDNLCIHSVCVKSTERRRGIAAFLLTKYIEHVRQLKQSPAGTGDGEKKYPNLSKISLICKDHLVKLYDSVGFKLKGPSSVVHGEEAWFDMDLEL